MSRVGGLAVVGALLVLHGTGGVTRSAAQEAPPTPPPPAQEAPPTSAPPAPTTSVAPTPPTSQPPPDAEAVGAGRELYLTACSSCHGPEGRGTDRAPSLVGVGAASADFQLSTGRMPADVAEGQTSRKPPAYDREEIDRLVAYVASLGPGPEIPRVDLAKADLALGGVLYANNCASCHSSAGAGGALGHAVVAPSLRKATSTQVAEAVRIGPGAMPRFGPDNLDDHQVASIARYVRYLREPDDRGGAGLGHLGPLPEGFVAWVVGLGACLVAIRWIGTTD
jgi:ubiquinol-cytochrome c reductase cytochrome c subunit